MLASHRYEFIYTKTFKTAGTSVEVFFEPFCVPEGEWSFSHWRPESVTDAGIVGYRGSDPRGKTWRNHMSAGEIRSKLGEEMWASYFKFCVIRNPYDKVVSIYNWKRHFTEEGLKTKIKNLATSASIRILQLDFQRWVHALHADRDRYIIDGSFCLDDVIFFERLQEDTRRISQKLQLPVDEVDLPRLKSGIRKQKYDTVDYYNEESRRVVEEVFRPEIEAFGYTFPEDGTSGPQYMRPDEVEWEQVPQQAVS